MSARIGELMRELGDDVAALTVPTAGTIRARARLRQQRRVAGVVMTVAAGATVSISLLGQSPPAGGGIVAAAPPDSCSSVTVTRSENEVRVYLMIDATDTQRVAIEHRLVRLPEVVSLQFESRAEAYQRFKEVYACAPDFVNQTAVTSLPESFIVEVKRPEDWLAVDAAVALEPGVDTILGPASQMRSRPPQ